MLLRVLVSAFGLAERIKLQEKFERVIAWAKERSARKQPVSTVLRLEGGRAVPLDQAQPHQLLDAINEQEVTRAMNAHATVTLAHHNLELRCPAADLEEERPLTMERQQASELLKNLEEGPAWRGKISVEVVRWDNPNSPTPMYANYTPQEAVVRGLPKPSACDLVVLILGGRFGTPQAEPLKADGSQYLSGTEWEYEDALAAKVPVLIYRRTEDPAVSLRDPEYSEKKRQLKLVDKFFKRFMGPGGTLTGGYVRYESVDAFEELFKKTVEGAIRQLHEGATPAEPLSAIIDRLIKEIVSLKEEMMIILRQSKIEVEQIEQNRVSTPPAEASIEVEHVSNNDIRALGDAADVVAIAPAMPMKLISPFKEPLSPTVSTAWGVKTVGAVTSPFTGDGVVVAVLDTGIDPTHPAFAGVTLVQKNFTTAGPNDQHGHGTHCAGTIFGRDVDGTRIGVAPGVKKALIGKVHGSGGSSSDLIADAINWAVENGAHVISMSLGIDFPGFVKVLETRGLPTEAAVTGGLSGECAAF